MSKFTDEVLGHADESDGIEEYDNPLPDWWLGLFFATVVWAAFYWVNITFLGAGDQATWYAAEMAAAEQQWPQLNQAVDFDDSPETLALGEETFTSTCVSCNGSQLEGGIGPNLVDAEWVHGGSYAEISATISEGVPAKGMPTWGPILGPKKVAAVASYILSKGTGEPPAAPADAPSEAVADAPAEAPTEAATAAVDGEAVFQKNCVACHQADLSGGIGPNLVDAEWLHGGTLADITTTVTNGVPAKGMVSWKGILDDAQIDAVASYIFEKNQAAQQ